MFSIAGFKKGFKKLFRLVKRVSVVVIVMSTGRRRKFGGVSLKAQNNFTFSGR